jgi:hypothetical protein
MDDTTIPQRWKNKGKIQFFSQVLTVKKDTFASFDPLTKAVIYKRKFLQ